MKFILVFVLWITLSDSGVVKWSQSEEDEAIKMYHKFCGDGGDSGVSSDDIQWHCKYPENSMSEESLEHDVVVTSKPETEKQVIFIQPQNKHYIHKIAIRGEGMSQPEVTIYVIPPKYEHRLEVDGDIKVNSTQRKPKTVFLKNHPFTFQLPGNPPPTPYPKPFGEPIVVKSPDLEKFNASELEAKPKSRLPRAQFVSVETV